LFATYGNANDPDVQPVVADVSACLLPPAEAQRVCRPEDPLAPAYAAGLRPVDELDSFNGEPGTDWKALRREIRANDDGRAEIVIRRDGAERTVVTNTTVTARPTSADDETLVEVGFLGVTPVAEPTTGGIGYTLAEMGRMTTRTLEAMVDLPA